jgi:hypothetical protein
VKRQAGVSISGGFVGGSGGSTGGTGGVGGGGTDGLGGVIDFNKLFGAGTGTTVQKSPLEGYGK